MAEPDVVTPSKYPQIAQIIVFNTIPLIGILFFHWDAALLILAYFIETIVALLFHAVRLWYVNYRWGNEPETKSRVVNQQLMNSGQGMSASWLPIFTLVFFGFFCFVQLMVLGGFANRAFPEGIFTSMYQAATGKLAWAVSSFIFLQLSRFFMEVIRGEYAFTPAKALFFQPFRRILVQQLTVILGGFFIIFGGTTPYVFILVLVNLFIDLFLLFIDNKKLKTLVTKSAPEAEKHYEELKKML